MFYVYIYANVQKFGIKNQLIIQQGCIKFIKWQ